MNAKGFSLSILSTFLGFVALAAFIAPLLLPLSLRADAFMLFLSLLLMVGLAGAIGIGSGLVSTVPMTPATREALQNWLAVRVAKEGETAMFVSASGVQHGIGETVHSLSAANLFP